MTVIRDPLPKFTHLTNPYRVVRTSQIYAALSCTKEQNGRSSIRVEPQALSLVSMPAAKGWILRILFERSQTLNNETINDECIFPRLWSKCHKLNFT
ncbi:hypothetical protein [Rhizobium ruizarguesonis]|uniref:hypothetical protein n=1 Tax=Rhizobium ruizarguesonis TaxID=2081791 RepID=UPI001CF2A3B9|nr:hypothetical protein [Rhizobium ruizarguesonis]MCB2403634.1 hypothetical protein [Rhizobium ruizarguesonis]